MSVSKSACPDTYLTGGLIVSNSGLISLACFLALLVSYITMRVSLRGRTAEGLTQGSLHLCSTPLLVMALFLGPCIFLYTRPAGSLSADKVVAVFYTVVTPVLNPMIYTLRNAEVKNSMKKLRDRMVFSLGV
uniref:Olfactory receptor 4E2 n=1 Tax=Sphaerodactylus townsendi TaxID=933632 RepID=A0ACB8EXG6_9SAUR